MFTLAAWRMISAERNDLEATPAEEKFIWPGFSCAICRNSLSDLAGKSVGTIITIGTAATWLTPAKSFTGSNERFLLMTPAMVCPLEVSISV